MLEASYDPLRTCDADAKSIIELCRELGIKELIVKSDGKNNYKVKQKYISKKHTPRFQTWKEWHDDLIKPNAKGECRNCADGNVIMYHKNEFDQPVCSFCNRIVDNMKSDGFGN